MSRTIRTYHERMCLRKMSNHSHKRQKAMLLDIMEDYQINLGNRARNAATPEPYDDIPVSGLSENKQIWKHDALPRPKAKYR